MIRMSCANLFSLKTSAMVLLLLAQALTVNAQTEKKIDKKDQPVTPSEKKHPLKEIWSGYHYSGEDIREMQNNPEKNPATVWAEHGREIWSRVEGKAKKSCSSCHNKAEASMKGIGARYPVYYEAKKTLINLEDRINLCRRKFMKASLFSAESDELLALTIYVKMQSQGTPVNVKTEGPATKFFEKGKKLYYTRRGQLHMSCANCHEQNAGKKLRASLLSQGQSNGYPAYRLSWEKPGSLTKRINTCNDLVRAAPMFSDDIKSLELYLSWRGKGLQVETPAVRR